MKGVVFAKIVFSRRISYGVINYLFLWASRVNGHGWSFYLVFSTLHLLFPMIKRRADMKSGWEIYKGKKVLFARYDHLTFEEMHAEIKFVEKEVVQQPADSVLSVINVTGTIITPSVLNLLKEIAVATNKQAHKTAVLGITGARRSMLEMVVKFSGIHVLTFDDETLACDWLVLP
jgi:hypothetical protein